VGGNYPEVANGGVGWDIFGSIPFTPTTKTNNYLKRVVF
jgi:hypothetical protein